MRYLVTGGAGFIGSSIAEALLTRGDGVTILDDLSSGKETNLTRLRGDVTVIRGDVCDANARARALEGVSGVFHEAAVASVGESIADPIRCTTVNVHGTAALLEDSRQQGITRFVFAASAAAYGDEPTLPKHEGMIPEPLSPYAVSKIAGEHYVRVYARLHGMRTAALRYFNVFGPRQDPNGAYAAVVPKFVEALSAGKSLTLFGDGGQTRDFCFIDNVVSANLLAMNSDGVHGEVFNIANGAAITIAELADKLAKLMGKTLQVQKAPERPGDIRHSRASIDRARSILGYEPTVSVDEGLRRTVVGVKGTAP